MNIEMEQLLAELLSGDLNEQDHQQLLRKIKSDSEAWEIYKMVTSTDKMMGEITLLNPSFRFTKDVLVGYDRLLTKRQNSRMMVYFSVMAALLVVLLIVLGLTTSSGVTNLPFMDTRSIGKQLMGVLSILGDKSFMMGFMLVNILLFLTVMDKWLGQKIFSSH